MTAMTCLKFNAAALLSLSLLCAWVCVWTRDDGAALLWYAMHLLLGVMAASNRATYRVREEDEARAANMKADGTWPQRSEGRP